MANSNLLDQVKHDIIKSISTYDWGFVEDKIYYIVESTLNTNIHNQIESEIKMMIFSQTLITIHLQIEPEDDWSGIKAN